MFWSSPGMQYGELKSMEAKDKKRQHTEYALHEFFGTKNYPTMPENDKEIELKELTSEGKEKQCGH
jgi:hypothetical protein